MPMTKEEEMQFYLSDVKAYKKEHREKASKQLPSEAQVSLKIKIFQSPSSKIHLIGVP